MTLEQEQREQMLMARMNAWLAWLKAMVPHAIDNMSRIDYLGGYYLARTAFESGVKPEPGPVPASAALATDEDLIKSACL